LASPEPGLDRNAASVPDRLVTPERSVFGTRLPRPTGVGRHLIVVLVVSLVALGTVVLFAEREVGEQGTAPQNGTLRRFQPVPPATAPDGAGAGAAAIPGPG
jgi:hypothetical protein